MNYIKQLANKAVWFALLYFAFVEGIEGARNVVIMLCWLAVILSPLSLIEYVIASIAKKPVVPMRWLNVFSAVATVVTLSWFGYLWLSGFYIVAHVLASHSLNEANKLRAKAELKAMASA